MLIKNISGKNNIALFWKKKLNFFTNVSSHFENYDGKQLRYSSENYDNNIMSITVSKVRILVFKLMKSAFVISLQYIC